MTGDTRLKEFLRKQTRVVVANGTFSWTGRIIGIADTPSILLEREDGQQTVLPQSFIVASTDTLPGAAPMIDTSIRGSRPAGLNIHHEGRHRREVTDQDRRNDWADATSGRPTWAGKHRVTGEQS